MNFLFGATVYSPARARGNAVSTVERGSPAGGAAYLLASVSGDLATPALEIIKSSFFQLSAFDAAAAKALCTAVPRSIVEAVAILLIVEGGRQGAAQGVKGHAYVATCGAGRVYRQRGTELLQIDGGVELVGGDSLLASSQDLTGSGLSLQESAANSAPAGFRNDLLDTELSQAFGKATLRSVVAVSAARVLR